MSEQRAASFLRLVHDRSESGEPHEASRFEPVQESLLLDTGATVLVCTTEELDERSFVTLFTHMRATLALDLRISPRFDFGTLNRRRALALFEACAVRYVDLGIKSTTLDACMAALMRVGRQELTASTAAAPSLHVVVFVDSEPDYRELGLAIGRHFRSLTTSDWEVVLRGPVEPARATRRIVFISHANPEDNNFVLWLQAQLQRLGYEVWSDLTRLRAGEVFWDSIEHVIRNDAIRVLVVVSTASMGKDGVLDEVALAVSVERSERLAGFVIPIRLDETPFSSLRANIARKNVLDFSSGWAKGLARLVSTLRQDQIPRGTSVQLEDMLGWLQQETRRVEVNKTPEMLTSNRLGIACLPVKIYFLQGTPVRPKGSDASNASPMPFTPFRGGWLTFHSPREIKSLGFAGLESQSVIATEELHAGNATLSSHLKPFERDRLMNRIFNAHLHWSLLERGMLNLADSKPPTLYVPSGLIEKDQVTFLDVDQKMHRRLLVGRSERRQLFWHLGLSAQFLTGGKSLQMRLKVIFTTDGAGSPVSPERMKLARRAFCKNWWNDRWRSLELALVSWMADGKDTIEVHSGEAGRLLLEGKPRVFVIPASIEEGQVPDLPDSLIDEMNLDSLEGFASGDEALDEIDEDWGTQ